MDTIIACCSGSEKNVAISLIRISGFVDISAFKEIFSINLAKIEPRKAYLTKLFNSSNSLVDEVLITFFRGPNSFNGENILEIAAHGNKINISNIIEVFVSQGLARVAENGEFTLRALKNKKLSLTQVEGLGQLLNSCSNYDLKEGLSLLNGSLSADYENLYTLLKELKITFELMMDFSEDVGFDGLKVKANEIKNKFDVIFNSLLSRAKLGKKRYLSLDLCIYGEPNVGKSTLFNSILNEERAIVSQVAGTTRDYISESLVYKNNEFRLIDTAGIRETQNDIEKLGIEKSNNLLKNAFFKILVARSKSSIVNNKLSDFDLIILTHSAQVKEFSELDLIDIPILFLEKKSDHHILDGANKVIARSFLEKGGFSVSVELSKNGSIGPSQSGSIGPSQSGSIGPSQSGSIGPSQSGSIGPNKSGLIGPVDGKEIGFCATSHLGSLSVREIVLALASVKLEKLLQGKPLTVDRHIDSLISCESLFGDLSLVLGSSEFDLGIALGLCEQLAYQLESLVGIIPSDDLLDSIFGNFCIGK